MFRRRAATSLAAGLAILAAAPIVWWATQPEPAGQTVTTVNAAAASALATGSASFSPVTPVTSGVSGGTRASVEADPPAAPATSEPVPEPSPAAAPVRIEVPALGVDTVVVPVGVDDEGEMEVPQDVDTIGWYRFGPAPGAAQGSAVLTGHVDDYRQGTGVFADLGALQPGDTVTVTDGAGAARTFSVISREEWRKGEVPLDRLFDRGGSARLVLITCGGTFNTSTLGYDDNVAITAVPVGG